jgi:Tfp pilus assembly protein PilE
MDVRSLEEKDIPTPPPHSVVPHVRARLAGERGAVTLVELLVVIPMMAVVLMGIYSLYNVGVKSQVRSDARVTGLLRQQNGLERMTREMRQSVSFTPVSSQVLDATTYVRQAGATTSVKRRVRYECVDGACKRWEGPENGALATGPETVISGVQNPDVFFFEPDSVNPTYVSVKLEVTVKGATNPIVLDGGFALRNKATT